MKITELLQMNDIDVNYDSLVCVDASDSVTKKITPITLFGSLSTLLGNVTFTDDLKGEKSPICKFTPDTPNAVPNSYGFCVTIYDNENGWVLQIAFTTENNIFTRWSRDYGISFIEWKARN